MTQPTMGGVVESQAGKPIDPQTCESWAARENKTEQYTQMFHQEQRLELGMLHQG